MRLVGPVAFTLALVTTAAASGQSCAEGPVFLDGFESGDTLAWGAPATSPYAHVIPADVGVRIGVGVVGPVPTEVYTGSTDIESPTTLENVVVQGCLDIDSDDVTVRNVIIDCNGLYPIHIQNGRQNVTVEYSRIDCESSSKVFYFQSGAPDATIARNEIIGCQDFFFIQGDLDGLDVRENYMHTLVGSSQAHADGFQIGEAGLATGRIEIRGNYIDPDNDTIGKNDVIFGTNDSEVELRIRDNYFATWGHYTLRCGGVATRCSIANNVFGPGFVGVEQYLLLANSPSPSEFCCNRYHDGEMVEEYFGAIDLVLGAEHVTNGCPAFP